MTSGIYAISRGERVYVGSAVDIRRRWYRHRSQLRKGEHHSRFLQRAWNKYGEGAFEFVVLEECLPEQLLEREQYYFDLYPDKYNCSPVAGSNLGSKRSSETRAKMSAAHMGNTNTRGHVLSDEHRAKIGAASRSRKHTPESRAKMSATLVGNQRRTGHVATPEARANMSAAAKARESRKREAKTSEIFGETA